VESADEDARSQATAQEKLCSSEVHLNLQPYSFFVGTEFALNSLIRLVAALSHCNSYAVIQ